MNQQPIDTAKAQILSHLEGRSNQFLIIQCLPTVVEVLLDACRSPEVRQILLERNLQTVFVVQPLPEDTEDDATTDRIFWINAVGMVLASELLAAYATERNAQGWRTELMLRAKNIIDELSEEELSQYLRNHFPMEA